MSLPPILAPDSRLSLFGILATEAPVPSSVVTGDRISPELLEAMRKTPASVQRIESVPPGKDVYQLFANVVVLSCESLPLPSTAAWAQDLAPSLAKRELVIVMANQLEDPPISQTTACPKHNLNASFLFTLPPNFPLDYLLPVSLVAVAWHVEDIVSADEIVLRNMLLKGDPDGGDDRGLELAVFPKQDIVCDVRRKEISSDDATVHMITFTLRFASLCGGCAQSPSADQDEELWKQIYTHFHEMVTRLHIEGDRLVKQWISKYQR